MSGFSDLVGNGAECGPGNSINGLMKQYNKDHSLEQASARLGSCNSSSLRKRDRFGHAQPSSSKQAFRQAFRQNAPIGSPNVMANEFMAQAGRVQGPGSFNFTDMHRELNTVHTKPGVAPPSDWSADFARHQAASGAVAHPEFERAFAGVAGPGPSPAMMGPAGPMHARPIVGGPM
ncbi:hypothetical protein GGI12_005678, partial [Dipsacomyces acuminosporus]